MGLPAELMEEGIRAAGMRLREILELTGDEERKNYVPVDWVSAVMSHIYTHPEHHGQTYHLTPRESYCGSSHTRCDGTSLFEIC